MQEPTLPQRTLPEPRTRLSAAERREQLLDVAGELFAAHGYHRLSMEQLADAAGVSKPVLYQHFPSKRALYLALVRDAVAEMEAQVRKALAGTPDNRARVEVPVRGDVLRLHFETHVGFSVPNLQHVDTEEAGELPFSEGSEGVEIDRAILAHDAEGYCRDASPPSRRPGSPRTPPRSSPPATPSGSSSGFGRSGSPSGSAAGNPAGQLMKRALASSRAEE
jgi:AcrR family transcriptional regulator